jgi:hypothetical protein
VGRQPRHRVARGRHPTPPRAESRQASPLSRHPPSPSWSNRRQGVRSSPPGPARRSVPTRRDPEGRTVGGGAARGHARLTGGDRGAGVPSGAKSPRG